MTDREFDREHEDQDSEPTKNAPDDVRPDRAVEADKPVDDQDDAG